MWISKAVSRIIERLEDEYQIIRDNLITTLAETERLKIENARLRSDMDWFKHRLTQVEKERAQLIAAAIGVKVSIPEFQVQDPDDHGRALHELPDLSTIGGDAKENDAVPLPDAMNPGVDYSQMPGYRPNR